HLFAGLQLHVRLLPVRPITRELAAAAQLAGRGGGANVVYLHLEQRLNRALDLRLIRVRGDFEAQRALSFFLTQSRFVDHRALDHLLKGQHYANASESFRAPSSLTNTCS